MKRQVARLLIALSALVTIALMQDQPWGDELIVLELLERWGPYGVLVELPLPQPHYPTWYLFAEIAGPGAAHTLSGLSLVVTSWLVMASAAALYGRGRGELVSGLLVSFSPYLAEQAGWLRMYAPLTALSAAGMYLVLADGRSWVPALIAGLIHPFGGLIAAVVTICHRTRASIAAVSVSSVVAAVFLLVKLNRPRDVASRNTLVDVTGMGHGIVPSIVDGLAVPAIALTGSPGATLGMITAAMAAVVTCTWADRRLLYWMWLPPAAVWVASHGPLPLWELKYFGMSAPGLAVAAANPDAPRRRRRAVLLVLGVLYTVSHVISAYGGLVAYRGGTWLY